jgi:hypothetical protein
MISISGAVSVIVYLLLAGLVFGLLYWLIVYCEGQFPGAPLFFKVARIVLVFLAVLVLIGVILSIIGDKPLFRP